MRYVLALVSLLLAVPAYAADAWTYGSSEHFEVYTTAGAGTARESLNYFERIHAFFAQELGMAPKQKVPTRLIIFSNDRQFAPYRPSEVAAAFYLAGADRDYIVMGRFDEESDDIVAHEYVHLVVRYSGAKLPVWLNEGLAEFFSSATPESGRMNFGKVPRNRLFYLQSGVQLIDINRMFAIGHDSPEYNTRTHAGVFYSEAWALTHMLAMDDRYRPGWKSFLSEMEHGATAADALSHAYKRTPDAVFRDLVNYIQRDQFLYRQTDYKLPPDGKPATRPADAFEAQLVTTNLLANTVKGEEPARAAFEKLEQEKPNDVALLESRAYFELRRGKIKAALPYFARAVEQGSTNAKMMMEYARLDPAQAPALVAKASAVAPENADVRIEHARLVLSSGQPADAIRLLYDALTDLDRQQAFDATQVMATAYMRINRLDDARQAAVLMAQFAEEGPQADFAKRLAKSIEDYAGQRAVFEQQRAQALADADPASDAPRPPVVTRSVVSSASAEPLVTVQGRIRNIDCRGGDVILEVFTGRDTVRLFVDNPNTIAVVGQPGFQVDLNCRPQDVAIKVSYKPGVDATRKTVGYVRVLDYR
jgi:hypothetical protein